MKVLESYKIHGTEIQFDVRIVDKGDFVFYYEISIPVINEGTKILLENKLKFDVIQSANVNIKDLLDPNQYEYVKEKYKKAASAVLEANFKGLKESDKNILINYILLYTIGLGELEILSYDENIEEITVNSAKDNIWIYHKKYGWCRTNLFIKSEDQIANYSSIIARRVGKQITNLTPMLDATLPDGSRVNATLFPISGFGNTITIRRFSKNPWTVTRMIKSGTITSTLLAQIWLYMQYEISFLVAGGTGSGKTSMLNALAQFIPPNHRVISIEDTRELTLPKYLQWVPLVTRFQNSEGKGEVTMLDLLINSLRMRPDRLLVGEVRRQREAEIMFEAMRTGHSVYATIHADNSAQAINRLTTPPINLPKTMLDSLGAIIVQFRNRITSTRRTLEIAEVLDDGSVNVLYRWNPKKEKYEKVNKMKKTLELIQIYTGMTEEDIMLDLKEKESILEWMVEKDIDGVDEVGEVISKYYTNKEELLKKISESL